MHFRKITALVVREFVAHHNNLPATEVRRPHILSYINALDSSTELVRCIYYAVCGCEPTNRKAELTVLDWIRHPQTICNILFEPDKVNKKNLGGDLGLYPMYNPQKVWVEPMTRTQATPSNITVAGIEAVLEEFQHPRYPNFNLPKHNKPKRGKRRPIGEELLNQPIGLPILLPHPSHSTPSSPVPSHSSPVHSHSSPVPSHSSLSSLPLKWSLSSSTPDSPLDYPVFLYNDLPLPSTSSRPSPHTSPTPGPSTGATTVETVTASSGLKPGDAVNVLTQGRPFLAGIVQHNDGEYITYFHPHLKVKKSYIVPIKYAEHYQPQCVDGKVKLLKEIKDKSNIKAAKKLVRTYENGLNKFLGRPQ